MKKMALLLCAVLFICTCAACSMEKETISVAYDLSASPKNIDPQNASTQDAAILLRHIMQGLYHIDSDGNVQKALAEDTSVSEDGKPILSRFGRMRSGFIWMRRKMSSLRR